METLLEILVVAAPVGSVYGLAASGLVLTYRTSRVFNFAHGAVGMLSAYLFYQVWVVWGVPAVPAAILVVGVLAPLLGLLSERLVFRPLQRAATTVKIVVTVGMLVALQGTASLVWGRESIFLPSLFPQGSVRVFGQARLGWDQVGILLVSLACLAGLGLLIRTTRFGLSVRASVDRPDLAELAGVNTAAVSAGSWAFGYATAALSGILLAPVLGLDAFVLTLFVIQAFAAALFGMLRSFPLTLAGGLLVAVLEESSTAFLPRGCDLCLAVRPAVPFALIFALLAIAALVPGSGWGRWVRAVPPEPAAPPQSRGGGGRTGWIQGAVALAAVAALGVLLEGAWLLRLERGLAMTGVFASLILLAGVSGQISLAHTAFAGTGAFVMGFVTGGLGLPFGVALVLAGLAAVPVAVFVALPSIRLHGLHVALLTFGFGLVVARFFDSGLAGGTSGVAVPRPASAASDGGYFWLLLGLAAVLMLAARNLQRSPSGRVLGAIRDSEVAARSVGANIPLFRLAVFALAAFMAGVAGAALGGLEGLVTSQTFHPLLSLMWLSVAVIGGMGSVWGAAIGGAVWMVGSGGGAVAQLGFGLGAMLLARNERGIAGILSELPSGARRIARTLGRAALAHEGLASNGADRDRAEEVTAGARG